MGLWIGSYWKDGGRGLYPLARDGEAYRLGPPRAAIANASFGAWSPVHGAAHFVHEQEAGRVTAWRPAAGAWESLGESETGGSDPCYLAVHPSGSCLAAANYADGSVALIELDPSDGAIRGFADLKRSSGRGPNSERQDGPHAHCTLFSEDGNWLFHVDLGLDRVFRYPVSGVKLGDAEVVFEAPPGSGPRHLALHPDGRHALLVCELSAELMLFERGDGGGLNLRHIAPTLPESWTGENLGGHLGFDPAARILVTNRGHDSLVSFAIEHGRLEPQGWAPTGGSSPRHFWTDGEHVIVAHEESGTLTRLAMPGHDAAAAAALIAEVPGAAFVFELPDG